jgi:Ferritin-like
MNRELWTPQPRNLTARADYQVPGNPAITRPEDAVANCYPGLELDVRNLDRRFFPGLVFEFVARDDTGDPYIEPTRYGARLSYVDQYADPDIADCLGLSDQLSDKASTLGEGEWYIEWIEQEGRRLSMLEDREGQTLPMDGLFVWRLIRGLKPKAPVTICLHQRCAQSSDVILQGIRRNFTNPVTGVISMAYQPGEMQQSLCSPWQHDFRDCYCHYWASNHPDIVFGELLPGDVKLPDGQSADPLQATTRLDWLRAERSPATAAWAQDSFALNRPFQYDAFQINAAWRDLNIVINNVEIGDSYTPPEQEEAEPYKDPADVADALRTSLAPLEMALAVEYLYARSSLLTEEEARSRPGDQASKDRAAVCVIYARHFLLLTAANEMQHLRWANELLWRLYQEKLLPGDYEPVLTPARDIPQPAKSVRRPLAMRRLEPQTLEDFIDVERPSGVIDGAYARIITTLRTDKRYPTQMQQLAERIANDGMAHERHFLDMRSVLRRLPGESSYLRELTRADPADPTIATAMAHFLNIKSELAQAFRSGAGRDLPAMGKSLNAARDLMDKLLAETDTLALDGVGFPYDAP